MDGLDSTMVQKMAGLGQNRIVPENYVFKQPLSPHLAAEFEGIKIDISLIEPAIKPDFLIIEGAGGVMTPLNENCLILDLIKQLAVPVLIVSLNRLGTINHTLLTITSLVTAGLDIPGVILNGAVNMDHKEAIEHYGKVPVLAQLEHLDHVTPEKLEEKFSELFL